MIHAIIGGSMSGKSTYVLQNYLMVAPVQFKQFGITVTGDQGNLAIGPYIKRKRGQGIDAISHSRGWVHTVISAIREAAGIYDTVVVEGNNILSELFFDELEKIGGVKMILLDTPIEKIRERAAVLDEPWNVNIPQTFGRALRIFDKYKGVFEHEIQR